MDASEHSYRVYKELAEREAERGAEQLRDRFLILAADAALSAGRSEEAEQLRQQLLQANPSHMLQPFTSMAEASRSAEVANYLADLRRGYPPEEAERLLESLHGEAAPASESQPTFSRFFKEPEPPRISEPERAVPPPTPPLPEPAPAVVPSIYRPAPTEEPMREASEEAPASTVSFYAATGLFVVVLAAALALVGHVFVRPFLP